LRDQCSATKRNGDPCRAPATEPDGYCWARSPQHSEQRRKMASHAGKSRGNRAMAELHETLAQVTEDIIAGKLKPYVGMSVSQRINSRIALLRLEKDLHEQAVLEERLERLEGLANHQQQRRPGWAR
jgi:hypothetical protein